MGFFLAMMMGINLILALTLHPLMLLVIKPRFVQRGVIANSNELETAP
jgi:predicted RND superfamily exporter protein